MQCGRKIQNAQENEKLTPTPTNPQSFVVGSTSNWHFPSCIAPSNDMINAVYSPGLTSVVGLNRIDTPMSPDSSLW